jgi:hypothetical protein
MGKEFLPEGYEVPKTGGAYMKFRQGQNKLRILSAPIVGWEYWTESRKPVRSRELWKVIPADADISGEAGWNPKHFWAMVVYSFDDKAIQILEITQVTVQRALTDLIQNPEWGDPRNYSITITRKGEKFETEYTVVPSPAKPTPSEILADYKAKKINLEALFDGKNPFEASERSEDIDAKQFRPSVVGKSEDAELEEVLAEDDPGF